MTGSKKKVLLKTLFRGATQPTNFHSILRIVRIDMLHLSILIATHIVHIGLDVVMHLVQHLHPSIRGQVDRRFARLLVHLTRQQDGPINAIPCLAEPIPAMHCPCCVDS